MPILAGEKSQFSSLDGGFLFSFYHHKQINGKKMSFFFGWTTGLIDHGPVQTSKTPGEVWSR
jgi:hypothetical protein